MPWQQAGENDSYRPSAAPATTTVRAPDALSAQYLLVCRIRIVTLYAVVKIKRAQLSAMGAVGLLQVHNNLLAFLLVANESNSLDGCPRYEYIAK